MKPRASQLMDIDTDKIDEAALELLHLTLREGTWRGRGSIGTR
jgi:hypothetical protein